MIKKLVGITTLVCVLFSAASNRIYGGSCGGYSRPLSAPSKTTCVPANEPKNLGIIKHEVVSYYESGIWQYALECVAQKAIATLKRYIPVGKQKLAVVFDIDDTSLSNWPYLFKTGFGYEQDRYKAWEATAQAPAIQPVLDLYRFARNHGFGIFFITGRRENQREATELNLKKAGFKDWNEVFFKPMDFQGKSAVEFKPKWRAYIQSLGFTIVLNIGDQMSDLLGIPRALNNFKLSNPMYFIP